MVSAYEKFGKKWTYWHPVEFWARRRRFETWDAYAITRLLARVKRQSKTGVL